MVERKTHRGKVFYGCSSYPKCTFATWDKPVDKKCPGPGGEAADPCATARRIAAVGGAHDADGDGAEVRAANTCFSAHR